MEASAGNSILNVGIQETGHDASDSASGQVVSFPTRFVPSDEGSQTTSAASGPPVRASGAGELCALILRVGQGDRTAFYALYQNTAPRLLGAAMRILGDKALAEDAVQDAYLRVWRSAGKFDPARGQALPWMGQIVRNACFDVLAKIRHTNDLKRDLGRVAEFDLAVLPIDPPDARLRACLDKLPPKQSRALILMYVHGMTHSELADYLGVPVGTVKSWITRGAQALRTCLGGQDG
jgi:RNA polymerase sigma-70 factor, ECF subfamily